MKLHICAIALFITAGKTCIASSTNILSKLAQLPKDRVELVKSYISRDSIPEFQELIFHYEKLKPLFKNIKGMEEKLIFEKDCSKKNILISRINDSIVVFNKCNDDVNTFFYFARAFDTLYPQRIPNKYCCWWISKVFFKTSKKCFVRNSLKNITSRKNYINSIYTQALTLSSSNGDFLIDNTPFVIESINKICQDKAFYPTIICTHMPPKPNTPDLVDIAKVVAPLAKGGFNGIFKKESKENGFYKLISADTSHHETGKYTLNPELEREINIVFDSVEAFYANFYYFQKNFSYDCFNYLVNPSLNIAIISYTDKDKYYEKKPLKRPDTCVETLISDYKKVVRLQNLKDLDLNSISLSLKCHDMEDIYVSSFSEIKNNSELQIYRLSQVYCHIKNRLEKIKIKYKDDFKNNTDNFELKLFTNHYSSDNKKIHRGVDIGIFFKGAMPECVTFDKLSKFANLKGSSVSDVEKFQVRRALDTYPNCK